MSTLLSDGHSLILLGLRYKTSSKTWDNNWVLAGDKMMCIVFFINNSGNHSEYLKCKEREQGRERERMREKRAGKAGRKRVGGNW